MKTTIERRHSALIHLAKTLMDARPALRRQAEDWDEGFSAATELTHTIGRSNASRVENAVISDKPRAGTGLADQCRTTATDIDKWIHEGYTLATRVLRLLPLQHPVAEMLARHAQARFNGAGYCEACGVWVEGADYQPNGRGHRIVQGLCPAHYEYWRANVRPSGLSATDWATREKAKRKGVQNESAGGAPDAA